MANRRRDGSGGDESGGGRRSGGAYQGAFEAVFAVVIGGGLGYAMDRHYATDPWGVLVGLGLGFGAFVLRLVRLGRALQSAETPGRDGPGGSRGET